MWRFPHLAPPIRICDGVHGTFDLNTMSSELPSKYLHPIVAQWFENSFRAPTLAQEKAWPAIARGEHTLLLAPTGSGKTLAAFLVAIDSIMFAAGARHSVVTQSSSSGSVRKANSLTSGVKVLYISPLKALGADVERNLREPLAGIQALANEAAADYSEVSVAIRSGDTPTRDRVRIAAHPPDILITTPESLYLMLTSKARSILTDVTTVIIDEIHTMVPTKRGTHLFVSLERLEFLRQTNGDSVPPLQRIGLSATQRPLDEVATLMGGSSRDETGHRISRHVTVVEAGHKRPLDVRVEVPANEDADLDSAQNIEPDSDTKNPSVWPAIHKRMVELINEHRSTMIFVNSRRLAERLATAINETAGEIVALAHHGSISKDVRRTTEERLKKGVLPAIVATSSLELGIDMGAVDLVIQVESPPSIASGMQRIGRASHHVGGVSHGVIFPKFAGDLLACGAAVTHMQRGHVEQTLYPQNPLDILAQQLVAIIAMDTMSADDLYELICGAAPFRSLPRPSFDNVLDFLSGRFPSDEFAELRPRLAWDRVSDEVSPRRGAQRMAILNGGTIPDRGLYGVFLAGQEKPVRVGELDEEMVFETSPGDVFLLGASSWRVTEITHDRVLVVPAPGQQGRMPFWRGDGPGRPVEFGRAIGSLARELLDQEHDDALHQLRAGSGFTRDAAEQLLARLAAQAAATGEVPSDTTIVVESFVDEVGDWRVAILSPFGARIHAPWAIAVIARLREDIDDEIDMTWTDDGIMFRVPFRESTRALEIMFPDADEIEDILIEEVGSTALFAAKFRENAARALLLPRQYPGRRTPLWVQRRKSADLLKVTSRYENFPIIVETFRECLRDIFDVPGLKSILADISARKIRVHNAQTRSPSPFASALLYTYTANYLYDQDAPLAETRARTLAIDYGQLRELLGSAALRDLLVAEVVDDVGMQLQRLRVDHPPRHPDQLVTLLREIGDLDEAEVSARIAAHCQPQLAEWLIELQEQKDIAYIKIAGIHRYIALEDAGRYRDALNCQLPTELPDELISPVREPLLDLVSRFARTHVPFGASEVATRFGMSVSEVQPILDELILQERLIKGEFLPGNSGDEYVTPNVLARLKQRSLAFVRNQIAPMPASALVQFSGAWHAVSRPRRGADGLLDAIAQLQGAEISVQTLEEDVLPARVRDFSVSQLDELCSSGELVWQGKGEGGTSGGKVALFLRESVGVLAASPDPIEGPAYDSIRSSLRERGALFISEIDFGELTSKKEQNQALWELVWNGEVSNDRFSAIQALRTARANASKRPSSHRSASRRPGRRSFFSRHRVRGSNVPGRWMLFNTALASGTNPTPTEKLAGLAQQLLERYGIITREMVNAEPIAGGWARLYPVFKAMEESGQIRRGYFVSGLGGAQFAVPGAEDQLREHRSERANPENIRSKRASTRQSWMLAASDPANPYGVALPWPTTSRQLSRRSGAYVVIDDGQLIAYVRPRSGIIETFLPDETSARQRARTKIAVALRDYSPCGKTLTITKIDGKSPSQSELNDDLRRVGFVSDYKGLARSPTPVPARVEGDHSPES